MRGKDKGAGAEKFSWRELTHHSAEYNADYKYYFLAIEHLQTGEYRVRFEVSY